MTPITRKPRRWRGLGALVDPNGPLSWHTATGELVEVFASRDPIDSCTARDGRKRWYWRSATERGGRGYNRRRTAMRAAARRHPAA